MASTLEKTVTKKVKTTKSKQAENAAEKARKEAEFQAKLPQTREERAKIVFPTVTDGTWDIYFDAGHWRLRFAVGRIIFEIYDEHIPYDAGTPTEGYGPTEAHWEKYLHVKDPHGSMMLTLGHVGDLDDSWLATRNDKDKDSEWRRKEMAKLIKELNDRVAYLAEDFLLHKDEYDYMERLRK